MCGICGCSEGDDHHHVLEVEADIFAKNNQFAQLNKEYFDKNQMVAFNVMSSPGSGKTTLLTKTLTELKRQLEGAVVVGDQHSHEDAKHLQTSGATAIQVNTGKVCHLDAHMLGHALEALPDKKPKTLFIENIGNLVCPAFFNLGEHYKIVMLSITEGDNKPLKYPEMFRAADLLLVTKIDLLPYVEFDINRCIEYARRLTPTLDVLTLSAKSDEGMSDWYHWLLQKQHARS